MVYRSTVPHKAGSASSARKLAQVAIVEEDAVTLAQLVSVLKPDIEVQPYLSLEEALEGTLVLSEPTVIVLGPSQLYEDVLDRTAAVLQSHRAVGALVVVADADATTLRVALRAGLDDAVSLDGMAEELPEAVRDLSFRLQSVASATAAAQPAAPAAPKRGRVTTVFSPKGGVGKSVVAVNLASALAQRPATKVLLVDLDVNFGDVAVMLRMQPAHHIGDALAAGTRIDKVLVEGLLATEERTHLQVLAAPPGSADITHVASESVSALLEVLRDVADHIVVDTAPGLDDTILQALSDSDDIVYIVGMDVPSVKNARIGLQALELLEIPLERVVVVLNRADSRVRLGARDVERTLQMKVDAALPSDGLVPQSVNSGVPAVIEFERSRFAGRMREMATLISDRASQKERA